MRTSTVNPLQRLRRELYRRCHRGTVASERGTGHSARMATPSSSRTPLAGGFLLAVSVLVGAIYGAGQGQASLGLVVGAGVGVVLLIAVWLFDRMRR